jgi:hypothetical protein
VVHRRTLASVLTLTLFASDSKERVKRSAYENKVTANSNDKPKDSQTIITHLDKTKTNCKMLFTGFNLETSTTSGVS